MNCEQYIYMQYPLYNSRELFNRNMFRDLIIHIYVLYIQSTLNTYNYNIARQQQAQDVLL